MMGLVCGILEKDNVPGAQTGRSGVVQAGEGFAWRQCLTGRLCSLPCYCFRDRRGFSSTARAVYYLRCSRFCAEPKS